RTLNRVRRDVHGYHIGTGRLKCQPGVHLLDKLMPTKPRPTPRRPARRTTPPRAPEPAWKQRLSPYWRLVRGDRPIGTLLLLWPTWWALWLAADGFPPWHLLLIFTAGVWLTRSAGCVINDYADRWLDPQVERTRTRPLATG